VLLPGPPGAPGRRAGLVRRQEMSLFYILYLSPAVDGISTLMSASPTTPPDRQVLVIVRQTNTSAPANAPFHALESVICTYCGESSSFEHQSIPIFRCVHCDARCVIDIPLCEVNNPQVCHSHLPLYDLIFDTFPAVAPDENIPIPSSSSGNWSALRRRLLVDCLWIRSALRASVPFTSAQMAPPWNCESYNAASPSSIHSYSFSPPTLFTDFSRYICVRSLPSEEPLRVFERPLVNKSMSFY